MPYTVATNKLQSILNKFVNMVLTKHKLDVKKIILFGSVAKGLYGPNSDCDILLVLKERKQEVINGIYDIVTEFLLKYGVDISLKIYSEKDFNRKISILTPFMTEIKKTGRELWSQQ